MVRSYATQSSQAFQMRESSDQIVIEPLNAMELLVAKEVERQIEQLPPKLAQYIKSIEVATYALNRLPPLYTCSEEGWRYQKQKGKEKLDNQITVTVRRAVAAVQRDPLRYSTPLTSTDTKTEYQAAYDALDTLRDVLQEEELSWDNLVDRVEKALHKAEQKGAYQAQEYFWRRRLNGENRSF